MLPAVRQDRSAVPHSELWAIIWTAGGLCWLCVTVIGILWFWPISGTVQGADYIVSSRARLFQHLLLFLLSVPAYRIGIGLGWPAAAWPRVCVIIVNAILALLVLRMAPYVILVSTTVIDAVGDSAEGMRDWRPMHATVMQWMMLLRFWLPPYVLGLIAESLLQPPRAVRATLHCGS